MTIKERIFKNLSKVELSVQKVEFSNLSILNDIIKEANKISIRGDKFKKNKRAFEDEKNVLNINSKQLISNAQKQIDNFKSKAKEMGFDVTKVSEYKSALNSVQDMKAVLKETN